MKLLKTKKKKVYHSVCSGEYEYTDKENVYIVELTEKEFIKAATIYVLNDEERDKLLLSLKNPPSPTEVLKELMKND